MCVVVVWTTTPDLKTARKLARLLMDRKLAACVSFREGFESVYRWKGNIERASEVLLLIKTSASRLALLEKVIRKNHSYDVPEFLVFPVSKVSAEYGAWLRDCLK